jgi:hypothetical protein
MQIRHRHVVEFESAREQPVDECRLCSRQASRDANGGRLLSFAFREHITSEQPARIHLRSGKTAAERIEQMLPRDAADRAWQVAICAGVHELGHC